MALKARSAPIAISKTYRIGDLAARSGRSVHAIRWYESQGLMPGVARDAGGRRVYSEQHLGWLDLMDRLRRTGMSIAEMRTYTQLVQQGRTTLAERKALLSAHRGRVTQTIAEWTQALRIVDSKIDYYGEWITSGHRPKLTPTQRREATPKAMRTKKSNGA
jgi:DNA-binding transcriptional MerR regulator